MPIHSCEIIANDQLAGDVYRLTFYSEVISEEAKPGQFIHVRVCVQYDPLLRRPFSIHDMGRIANGVDVLYKAVGSGTRILASKQEGETVDVLGPLGRGFDFELAPRDSLVIAGGIGIAPFPFFVRQLTAVGRPVRVIAGWKTAEEIAGIEEIESFEIPVEIATEDGSYGFKGTVTDLFEEQLKNTQSQSDGIALYACGPEAMLAKVARLARLHDFPCQLSIEERMACGIGACFGCAVPGIKKDQSDPDYRLVCKDGPVFDIDEVSLD